MECVAKESWQQLVADPEDEHGQEPNDIHVGMRRTVDNPRGMNRDCQAQ